MEPRRVRNPIRRSSSSENRERGRYMTEEEETRRAMLKDINADQRPREEFDGQTWDTEELKRDFEGFSFLAPFVSVRRKSDGKKGVLLFRHDPRVYFGWVPEEDP